MNIAVYSLFRDDARNGNILRYFNQIHALEESPLDNYRFYLVQGDSKDDTHKLLYEQIQQSPLDVKLLMGNTGRPRHYSVVNDERFITLAQTANFALEAITLDGWASHIMLIESDLIIPTNLLIRLSYSFSRIGIQFETNIGIIAPLIMAGSAFYDIWGFRHAPNKGVSTMFHKEVEDTYKQLYSVGSVALYTADPIYKGYRFDKGCMFGLCDHFNKEGYTVWLDSEVVVNHPL